MDNKYVKALWAGTLKAEYPIFPEKHDIMIGNKELSNLQYSDLLSLSNARTWSNRKYS